jgi:hypothetical protein
MVRGLSQRPNPTGGPEATRDSRRSSKGEEEEDICTSQSSLINSVNTILLKKCWTIAQSVWSNQCSIYLSDCRFTFLMLWPISSRLFCPADNVHFKCFLLKIEKSTIAHSVNEAKWNFTYLLCVQFYQDGSLPKIMVCKKERIFSHYLKRSTHVP